MARTAVLGFPRIGAERELKTALEGYWAGRADAEALETTAAASAPTTCAPAPRAGIDVLPVGDFSLYDHVLDTAELFGAVPSATAALGARPRWTRYFADGPRRRGVPPLELTKWFDTNYHYLVPELAPGQAFAAASGQAGCASCGRRALGHAARPVVLGPSSLLLLAKGLRPTR